jgi:small-conductance mechanosensitive channel
MFANINKKVLIEIGIHIGIVLAIIILTFILAKLVKKVMSRKERFVLLDKTQYKFMSHFVSGIIYFLGLLLALYSVPALRGLGTSLLASSGVLAIVIGFASQQAFSNIISGIFIAIFKPFRIGDRLRLEGKIFFGMVEDITLRHTVIRTFENKRIIIPNSVISSEILENENIVEKKVAKFFDMGISYDSDVNKAIQIIKEEALKHPLRLDNRTKEEIANNEEPVKVRVIGYGESSVNLRAYVWVNSPPDAFILGCDLNQSVKERFDKEGIEIPFPYRTLVFKDETHEIHKKDEIRKKDKKS